MNIPHSHRLQGFTLLELTMVLVIIGLLASAVLVGRELVTASQIRATIAQVEQFNAAVNTFRGKYEYLPGDILADKAAALNLTSRSGNPGHGDGNGQIEGCAAGATDPGCEVLLFWQDLAAMKLIKFAVNSNVVDDYVDAFASLEPDEDSAFQLALEFLHTLSPVSEAKALGAAPPGSNALAVVLPKSPLGETTYFTVFSAGGINYYELTGMQYIYSGSYGLVYTMTPEMAYKIDQKMDDGLPLSGLVRADADESMLNVAAVPSANGCVSNAQSPYPYNVSGTYARAFLCQLEFRFN